MCCNIWSWSLQVEPDPETLQTLTCMGFNQESAANALRQCRNKQANAIAMLVSWGPPAREVAPSVGLVDAEASSSNGSMSKVTASAEGKASRQMVTAAALLAQALQSSPAGQQFLLILIVGRHGHVCFHHAD